MFVPHTIISTSLYSVQGTGGLLEGNLYVNSVLHRAGSLASRRFECLVYLQFMLSGFVLWFTLDIQMQLHVVI